jgi:hypothetical protein
MHHLATPALLLDMNSLRGPDRIGSASLHRHQSRKSRKEQLDDGIGDALVWVLSSGVAVVTGIDTKV